MNVHSCLMAYRRRMRLTLRLELERKLCLLVVSLCLLVSGTACAQTDQRGSVAVFEARAAALTAQPGWSKKVSTTQTDTIYIAPQAFITGNDVAGAVARTDALGRALVVLTLKPASSIKLMAATARQENTHIALLINGDVVATVPAKGPMTGGRLAIEGLHNIEEARQLAESINASTR